MDVVHGKWYLKEERAKDLERGVRLVPYILLLCPVALLL